MEKRFQEYKTAIVSQENRRLCMTSHQFSGDVYDILSTSDFRQLEILTQELKEVPFFLNAIMEKKEQELGDQANIIFEMGSICGLLELCERIYKNNSAVSDSKKVKTIYKDQILMILHEEGMILHKRLAELLGVSPSNLSNIIKRLLKEDISLISVQELGKFKYYMLTSTGSQYVRRNLIKGNEARIKATPKTEVSLANVYKKEKTIKRHTNGIAVDYENVV